MSANIAQIRAANPISNIPGSALMYWGIAPYGSTDNAASTSQEYIDQITSNNLSVFGSTTSAQLISIITDPTGTGSLVFATGPTLVTPSLGVATATSINGTSIPSSATLAALGTANTFTKAQAGAFVTLTDAATIAIDSSLGNNFNLTLGGNRALGIPTNMVAGTSFIINTRQDITGSRTLTSYPWCYEFVGGVPFVLSTPALSFDQILGNINSFATSTVLISISGVNWPGHGLISGQKIQLTTTGTLPPFLAPDTTYWVTVVDVNTFALSSSLANAQAGVLLNTSGSQSGVHTATNASITLSLNPSMA